MVEMLPPFIPFGIETLFILDASVFLMLVILANLSQRIGEALQITPHYRILRVMAVLLLVVMLVDIVAQLVDTAEVATNITLLLRAMILMTALPVVFRYWVWLFNENLTRK